MEHRRCVVERITYQNTDNGYSVIKCRAKGYQDLVTVVGSIYRYAMNTADTRSWETLPKEFQVAQIPMPSDRKVHVNLKGAFGGPSFDVSIPATCRSAVLYVSAPSPNNVRGVVLPFESK